MDHARGSLHQRNVISVIQESKIMSSTETEYIALASTISEAIWIDNIVKVLGLLIDKAKIFEGNQSVINCSKL